MADVWGYCSNCERWYYHASKAGEPYEPCPVCFAVPALIEDREAAAQQEAPAD